MPTTSNYLIFALMLSSCQGQMQYAETETVKNNIDLDELSDQHPNKKQMESLLNCFEEPFMSCEVDKDTLGKQHLIQKQFCFQTEHSHVRLSLFFCKHQDDAISIAEANFNSDTNPQKWGVNGAVLFVVKGQNESEVNRVLAHFSGEE